MADAAIDNVFVGRDMMDKMAVEFRDIGIGLTLEASENFTHMIAYTPTDKPFLCMENLTCSPNAPNLYHKDKEDISALIVVAPGANIEGFLSGQHLKELIPQEYLKGIENF